MRRRAPLYLGTILTTVLLLSSCAVRNAPQINTETQWRLNTVSQLTDIQLNYTTFFKDVGDASRQGILTPAQVTELNTLGYDLKKAIESANTEWAAYLSAPSGDHKAQVINALLAAEQIVLQLTTKKANMVSGGGK